MSLTAPSREVQQEWLDSRGPLSPQIPPPRLPRLEEVSSFCVVPGVITTQTLDLYDVGIRFNEEDGIWIVARGLSYPHLQDLLGAVFEEQTWLAEVLRSDSLSSYYPLPHIEEACASCPTFKRSRSDGFFRLAS